MTPYLNGLNFVHQSNMITRRYAITSMPNVDSAVIRLDILAQPPVAVADRDYFFKVVQAAFCYRRKTALNSISAYLNLDKTAVAAAIEKSGAGINCRAQELTLEQFASISKLLKEEQ